MRIFETGMMACDSWTSFGQSYSTDVQAGTSDIPIHRWHMIGCIVVETWRCPWALQPPTHPQASRHPCLLSCPVP